MYKRSIEYCFKCVVLISLLVLPSCMDSTTCFDFNNISGDDISDIQIVTSNHRTKSEVVSLQNNRAKSSCISLNKQGHDDSSFLLIFQKRMEQADTVNFGYITHGTSFGERYEIIFTEDTTAVLPISKD